MRRDVEEMQRDQKEDLCGDEAAGGVLEKKHIMIELSVKKLNQETNP